MSKSTQAMNLSKWFGIDKILFGKRSPKEALGEGEFQKYNIAKGALLSNLFEIFKILDYNPELELKTTREMADFACQSAELALGHARNVLTHEDVSKKISSEINSLCEKADEKTNTRVIAEELIDRNIKATALDVYLMEDAIEKSDISVLKNSEGKIMVAAYKKLRDAMINYTRV